jgi:hypothetical protein
MILGLLVVPFKLSCHYDLPTAELQAFIAEICQAFIAEICRGLVEGSRRQSFELSRPELLDSNWQSCARVGRTRSSKNCAVLLV